MARRLSWLNVVAGLLVAMGSALVMPAAAADAAPSRASTVSTGYLHTCAVTSKGAARCWGANEYGQLGNNTTADSSTPVGVHGLGSKVKNVSSGYLHSCALTAKGRVWCWGNNSYGQLGDNSTTNSARPVAVVGLGAGVRAIDAGWFDTCAITAKGAVKCWGNNSYGQLGNNTTTSSLTPVGVHGLTRGVKAVSASYFHTCAITAKGAGGQHGERVGQAGWRPWADQGCEADLCRLHLHLRGDQQGRSEVLGQQPLWAIGRQLDHHHPQACGRLRAGLAHQVGEGRGLSRVRLDHGRRSAVLGIERRGPAG